MKNSLIIISLMLSNLCFSQVIDEIPDDPADVDLSSASFRMNMRNLEYFDVACADNFVPPVFPGGEDAFKSEADKFISIGINRDAYAPNGIFNIVFMVKQNGEMDNIKIGPDVTNSELFYEDLKNSIEKISQEWQPATCANLAVPSVIRMKISFISDEANL